MTPEQKKTLLEMSLLMRKNREMERERVRKELDEAKKNGTYRISWDIEPLLPATSVQDSSTTKGETES